MISAIGVSCLYCNATAGRPCMGSRGKAIKSFHWSRRRDAKMERKRARLGRSYEGADTGRAGCDFPGCDEQEECGGHA